MPLLLEHWKPVLGFEDKYSVSITGRVFSWATNKAISPYTDCHGYLCLKLWRNGKQHHRRIHQLVAEAFIGERPLNLVTNHKDGFKLNNRASNFEYITNSQNVEHAHRTGLITYDHFRGERHPRSTLLESEVIAIRLEAKNEKVSAIARRRNLSDSLVSRIVNRRRWASVK